MMKSRAFSAGIMTTLVLLVGCAPSASTLLTLPADSLAQRQLQTRHFETHAEERVLARPADYDAWAELMWAGTIAHNNLLNTGRIGDWASHDIEHELSALYDVAHGAGLAVVFPAWMQYVFREDVQRFVQFAVRVWDVDLAFGAPERIALEGIARMKDFYAATESLGVLTARFGPFPSPSGAAAGSGRSASTARLSGSSIRMRMSSRRSLRTTAPSRRKSPPS